MAAIDLRTRLLGRLLSAASVTPPALVQVAEHHPLRDDGLRNAVTLAQP